MTAKELQAESKQAQIILNAYRIDTDAHYG